jgi:pimeloyl-ACP methyl ester carboxylesterase
MADVSPARGASWSTRTIELGAERSLHAALGGEGRDIVLLHGAIATHRDWLVGPFGELTRLGRVIAIDRPGHGRSRRLRFEAGPRAQAAQIRAGLEVLNVRRAIIVAHSFGSRTALAYAELFPEAVAQLVLVAPAAFPEIRPWEHAMLAPRAVPVAGPALAQIMAWAFDRPMLEMIHRLMFAPQSPGERWMRNYPWDSILDPMQSVAEGEEFVDLHPLGPSDPIDLGNITAPTHILAGTGDLILEDRRQAAPLSRILPNARLTLLEGVGHMLHHSAPDVVLAAVEQSLAAS